VSRQPSELRISRTTVILLGLLICTLLALNIGLIIQNKHLRTSSSTDTRSAALKIGNIVPSLSGLDADGNDFSLDYHSDPRKAVMLIFSPHCGFCTKNMPNWQAIIRGIDQKSYRLFAVSVVSDGVKEYLAKQGLTDIPVIAEMDPTSRDSYDIKATPQTVLINSEGKVEKVWTGVIEPSDWPDLEQSLGLKPVTVK
jgi:peroxiredoxin